MTKICVIILFTCITIVVAASTAAIIAGCMSLVAWGSALLSRLLLSWSYLLLVSRSLILTVRYSNYGYRRRRRVVNGDRMLSAIAVAFRVVILMFSRLRGLRLLPMASICGTVVPSSRVAITLLGRRSTLLDTFLHRAELRLLLLVTL